MQSYTVCNLRLISEVPLPYLKKEERTGHAPDVAIHTRHIPPDLGQLSDLPYIRFTETGTMHYGDDYTPHFLIRSNEITADPRHPNWKGRLFGSVIGTICYLNGLLPLHASAVRVGSNAVAFVGPSGAGKSTLAAVMAMLGGHELIADEICAIDMKSGVPLANAYLPYHRLSERSADLLGIATPRDPCLVDADEKRMIAAHRFATSPWPLRAIYFLEPSASGERQGLSLLSKLEAAVRVKIELYRHDIGQVCVGHERLLRAAARLVDAVEVRRLCRGPDHLPPGALLTMIEDDIRQLG